MRILRLLYFIKLENLFNSRIKIKQINLIKLKFNLTITLNFYNNILIVNLF